MGKNKIFRFLFTTVLLCGATLLYSNNSIFNNGVSYRKQTTSEVEKSVDSLFNTLSLRAKIAQLFIVDYSSSYGIKDMATLDRLVSKEGVGGLIIMGDKMTPAINGVNRFNNMAKVPMLVSIDGEWGASMRFKELPAFPRQMQLGALSSDSLIYKMGYAIGEECRELNIHINYAPCVDINNNPNNPAINTRSFGEQKERVAEYGIAYMQGMKDAGVAGSAKHFPGHGDTDVDSHHELPIIPFSMERLDSLEFYPFKRLISAGVDMVMVGHLDVPTIEPGRPASISKKVITDVLRGELGYNGIVCTDALNMYGVSKSVGLERKDIPLEAYKAGADILLMAQDVENAITVIENAIKKGELSEAELDNKVRKVLTLKANLGLFNKSFNPIVNAINLEERMIKEENLALITELSKRSITVVTNKNNLLPLGNIIGKKIGYLGWGGEKTGKEFATTLLNYANVDTIILRSPVKLAKLQEAKRAFAGYDIVITAFHNTDSRAAKNFGLIDDQIAFLTDWAASQTMAVAYFGSPYAINMIENFNNFNSFVLAYSNTPENNFAAAQTIFGGSPAIGVLPVGAGEFASGESIILPNQTRLGYYLLPDKLKISDPFYVESNVIKGDISSANSEIIVKNGAALFNQLPLIAKILESGNVKIVDFLGAHLDNIAPEHKNILVWDLMSQRSGLPAVSDDFITTKESIKDFIPNPSLLPEFSKINLYYLEQIIEKYAACAEQSPAQAASTNSAQAKDLLLALEMINSSIEPNGDLLTTPLDLAKFNFMLTNGGLYASEQVFSKFQAETISDLLFYYY